MKLNPRTPHLGNSSGFYKDNNYAQRPWYVRWWAAVRAWLKWGWDFTRKTGWVLSSVFLILVLPTLMAKTLEFDTSLMNEFPGSPVN